LVGSQQLLSQFEVPVPKKALALYTELSTSGETMMYVTNQSKVIGLIGVRDKIRPEAERAIADLRSAGVPHLLLFTGDNEESARSVAQQVGLAEWARCPIA
jgi:P-type E1-E2 ATPase